MLEEKKKIGNGCIRFIIFIIISVFLLWTGFIVVVFVIFFIFVGGNKKNIDFGKILKILGVYECAKFFFGDFDSNKNSNGLEGTRGTVFDKNLEKMNNYIKKRALELKRKEKEKKDKNIKTWEEIILQEKKDDYYNKAKNTSVIIKNDKKENFNRINKKRKINYIKKNKIKSNNTFNNGKSIWDDYESVIDIMNKNNK